MLHINPTTQRTQSDVSRSFSVTSSTDDYARRLMQLASEMCGEERTDADDARDALLDLCAQLPSPHREDAFVLGILAMNRKLC